MRDKINTIFLNNHSLVPPSNCAEIRGEINNAFKLYINFGRSQVFSDYIRSIFFVMQMKINFKPLRLEKWFRTQLSH